MNHAIATVLACVLTLTALPAHAVTREQREAALVKAIEFLLSRQKVDGSWEAAPRPEAGDAHIDYGWGDDTTLAMVALLSTEMSRSVTPIQRAIEWLEREDLHSTRSVGLRAQVWNLTHRGRQMKQVEDHDLDFLLFSRFQRGPHSGFYGKAFGNVLPGGGFAPVDHAGPPQASSCDRSSSQYAVTGMWALQQAGGEIPAQYWHDVDAAWKKAQLADGGWDDGSGAHGGATWTMTCDAVTALLAIQDGRMRLDYHPFDKCAGGASGAEIKRGLAWIDSHIGQVLSGPAPVTMDGWYTVARVGVASGRRYFDGVDWYKTGAEAIIRSQNPDGGWGSIRDTASAIAFLAVGSTPVMMQKLQYASATQADPWNERPRDVANIAKWSGGQLCLVTFNWQLIGLDAPADDLHDSSILFISGSEALQFNDEQIGKLRTFIEEGGMILGNADCEQKAFAKSFMQLGARLFPKYEFRKLPSNHPMLSAQFRPQKWKMQPQISGMSNGVRELMVICPDLDMGRAWQTNSFKTREGSFELASNIFLYAVGAEHLVHRSDSYLVRSDGSPATRAINVARIEVGENWDPEPGAWRRLSANMHNQHHLDVLAEPVKLGQGKLAGYKIAALTGTTRLTLNDGQRKEIKAFVDNGGTLIVDAAGGAVDFADAAEAELNQMFGNAALQALRQPLPLTHALYADPKIETIKFRNFARRVLTDIHDPHLCAINADAGRIGVFFSREDITAGLVGEPVDGIIGYDPAVATQLMINMILYADKNR